MYARTIKSVVVAVFLGLGITSSGQVLLDGNHILKTCPNDDNYTEEDTREMMMCWSYIVGIAHSANYNRQACLPDNWSSLQMSEVVLKYVKGQPEQMHKHQFYLVHDAIVQAFPCKKED